MAVNHVESWARTGAVIKNRRAWAPSVGKIVLRLNDSYFIRDLWVKDLKNKHRNNKHVIFTKQATLTPKTVNDTIKVINRTAYFRWNQLNQVNSAEIPSIHVSVLLSISTLSKSFFMIVIIFILVRNKLILQIELTISNFSKYFSS